MKLKLFFLLFFMFSETLLACSKEGDDDYLDLVQLYRSAQKVLKAEDGKCDGIKDRDKRSECKCRYRKEPLIEYRTVYDQFVRKYPEFIVSVPQKTLCFSNPDEQNFTISIMSDGYKAIANMCNGS